MSELGSKSFSAAILDAVASDETFAWLAVRDAASVVTAFVTVPTVATFEIVDPV